MSNNDESESEKTIRIMRPVIQTRNAAPPSAIQGHRPGIVLLITKETFEPRLTASMFYPVMTNEFARFSPEGQKPSWHRKAELHDVFLMIARQIVIASVKAPDHHMPVRIVYAGKGITEIGKFFIERRLDEAQLVIAERAKANQTLVGFPDEEVTQPHRPLEADAWQKDSVWTPSDDGKIKFVP